MKNMNNKSIILAFGILAILAFGAIIIPVEANAQYARYRFNPDNEVSNEYARYRFNPDNTNITYFTESSPEQIYYYQAPANPSTSTTYYNTPSGSQTINETDNANKSDEQEEDYSGLAANAVFGGSGFLPSGLVQWILLAIFILIMVIIARRITGARNKYHSLPLKHA